VLIPLASKFFGALSWSAAQRLGGRLGTLTWHLDRRQRNWAIEHVEIAFPDMEPGERRTLAKRSIVHMAVNVAECLHVLGRGGNPEAVPIRTEGWANLENARRSGRPILMLTGHCGNWELIGAVLARAGVKTFPVVRHVGVRALNETLMRLRAHMGAEPIVRGEKGSAGRFRRAIRGDGVLFMLIDQDTRTKGAFVPFFGRLAYTPIGAAQLALRYRMAVVPAFVERCDDGSLLARFLPTLDLPDDAVESTALMTQAIEAQIRRRPEQWVWTHRRWRRRPELEQDAIDDEKNSNLDTGMAAS
jgi:KDO2-lipid IV(A) lauroyltransferase